MEHSIKKKRLLKVWMNAKKIQKTPKTLVNKEVERPPLTTWGKLQIQSRVAVSKFL